MKWYDAIAGVLKSPIGRCADALESIDETLKRAYPAKVRPAQTPEDAVHIAPTDEDYARWEEQERLKAEAGEPR